jgi:hypothetical protein
MLGENEQELLECWCMVKSENIFLRIEGKTRDSEKIRRLLTI